MFMIFDIHCVLCSLVLVQLPSFDHTSSKNQVVYCIIWKGIFMLHFMICHIGPLHLCCFWNSSVSFVVFLVWWAKTYIIIVLQGQIIHKFITFVTKINSWSSTIKCSLPHCYPTVYFCSPFLAQQNIALNCPFCIQFSLAENSGFKLLMSIYCMPLSYTIINFEICKVRYHEKCKT